MQSNARKIYRDLAGQGVIVRYRGNEPHCKNCLRITVGTPEENDTLIQTLKQVNS
jgi:histidinol-phosphate aminotransferase